MSRLDRYLLRELVVPFLIGTAAVVLMFQANTLIAQLKLFELKSVPFSAVLQYVLYKTPQFLSMTLPVGMALASSLAVSRLVRESELTAIRATGTPILRVMVPITVYGILVSLASWLLVEKIVPSAETRAKKVQTEAAMVGPSPQFRANVVVYLKEFTASFASVSSAPDGAVALTDALLIERPKQGEIRFITAKTGSYKDGEFRFGDVHTYNLVGEVLATGPAKDMLISERITLQDFFTQPESAELTAAELLEGIREGRAAGRDMSLQEVDYHTKFSVPAACAVFALVGPIFAVALSRSGAFVGVFLSIIICFLYWNAFVVSTLILGKNGIVSPVVAAWLPNALFVVLGVIGLRRLE